MAKVKPIKGQKVKKTSKSKSKSGGGAADLLAPLTPKSLQQETNAAVRLRYGGQEQALQGQIRASGQASTNAASWFGDYRRAVDASTQRTRDIYADAQNAIRGTADQSSQVDAGNRNDMLARMQADAQKRGATVDPSIAQTGVQAEASRRAGLDNHLAATTRVGAAQSQYMNDQGRIGEGRKVNALLTEQGRKRSYQSQYTTLKGQEGDFATTYKAGRVQQERSNQIAAQGLGIKAGQLGINQQNANTKSFSAKTKAAIDAGKLKLDGTKFASAQEKDAYQRAHGLGPYKPGGSKGGKKGTKPRAETVHSQNIKGSINNAAGRIRAWRSQGATGPQITVHLNNEGYSGYVLNAARDLVYRGRLSGSNIAALRNAGVRIPRSWLHAKKPPKGTH